MNYGLNFFIGSMSTAITTFALAMFVISINPKSKLYRYFFFYTMSIAVWSFPFAFMATAPTKQIAIFLGHAFNFGVSFICVFFMHFVLILLNIEEERIKKIVRPHYIIAIIFTILIPTKLMVVDVVPKFGLNYFINPGLAYYLYVLWWIGCVAYGMTKLYTGYRNSTGARRNQLQYLFLGSFIGYIGGPANFLLVFDLKYPFYPFGTYGVPIYTAITAYAIVKHHLLDINIALTRAGIFLFVYSFVLGIPFGLAIWRKEWLISILGQNWFWAPMTLLLGLATAGPFIYQYLRRRAEEVILKDQKQYQKAIRENSSKMLLIKELDRLLNTAGSTIIEAVKVSFVGIYLEDEKAKKYTARYKQAREEECDLPEEFTPESELVRHLSVNKAPIIGEEVSGSKHKIGLAVPLIIGDTLLGFLLLGDKPEGRVYAQDDVDIFTIMANQISLAIENCQFYQRERENQAMFYQSATLADMGVMADSMGHQIKNHIQKMSALAGGNAGMIEEALKKEMTLEEALAYLKRIAGVLLKIEGQGETGGRLIESISQFSRLPSESFRDISFKEIADRATDIAQYKVKFDEIDYSVTIPPDLPILYAHPILIEALFNLIDNAYDATRQKLAKLRKSQEAVSYKGSVTVSASAKDSQLEIQVKDNGIGIKKENSHRLFIPYFTTKATSIKGKGLGLFVIKRIVENHEGTIRIDSEYMQGTTFIITIPIRAKKEEKKEPKQEEE